MYLIDIRRIKSKAWKGKSDSKLQSFIRAVNNEETPQHQSGNVSLLNEKSISALKCLFFCLTSSSHAMDRSRAFETATAKIRDFLFYSNQSCHVHFTSLLTKSSLSSSLSFHSLSDCSHDFYHVSHFPDPYHDAVVAGHEGR